MCGICGIIDLDRHFPPGKKEAVVSNMNRALEHRGPDEDGSYADAECALAMRRLSIIDLPGGRQPISNETGEIIVFFNGEIYNYRELRSGLLKNGHQFRTSSDTEVLAHLYEEQGEKMLPMLKGMFALCIYDIRNKSWLLARDRFGEKPLFYYQDGRSLSFSSEIGSLLQNRSIPRKLNTEALAYYFRTSLVPEPLTMLREIKSLPPGHFLKISRNGSVLEPYFSIKYQVDHTIKTEEEACEFIRPILARAVKRQSVSDVPIGAFLSGGIDSSTVSALLQKQSGEKIKTFTVRFQDQTYDESPVAREVAEFCGTDHHELYVPNYDFNEAIFWEIIDHVGQPFRDSSAIPTYFIAREIRKHVKVALSGDGGDELFGGYALFQWYRKIIGLQKAPRLLRDLGDRGLTFSQQLPGLKKVSALRQLKRAVATSLQPADTIPISLNEMFSAGETADLMRSAVSGAQVFPPDLSLLRHYPPEAGAWSPLRKIMYYRAAHTLPGNMLVKVDRMSMANALEVRAPFLDPDLFDAAASLPDRFLIRGGTGKYILRKIMEKELPAAVFSHPKQGFSIPLYKYQNEAFASLASQLLYHENPFPGLFPRHYLDLLYIQGTGHKSNDASLSVFRSAHRLWMFMQLFGWANRFKVTF